MVHTFGMCIIAEDSTNRIYALALIKKLKRGFLLTDNQQPGFKPFRFIKNLLHNSTTENLQRKVSTSMFARCSADGTHRRLVMNVHRLGGSDTT